MADSELRFGGPQGEGDDSGEVERKAKERELKKAEVRKRLEEAGKKKSKKGFLTPERKKKLRKLLMIKAAENLKSQQLKSEQERQNALKSRVPALPDVDNVNDKGQLEKMYNDLFAKMVKLEEEKYDINYAVSSKDSEINELSIAVNDLRGKFVKPSLKKVSKYDNKFKKMADSAPKGEKQDFRSQLKVVKKENIIDDLVAKTKKSDKPEWSKKGGAVDKDAPPPSPTKATAKAANEPPAEEEAEEEPEGEEEAEEGDEEEEEE